MNTTEVLAKWRGIDCSSYPYAEVKELIRNLERAVFFIITLPPRNVITRARQGASYTCRAELSYKPQTSNDKCQRASTPNKTMFYGTIIENEQTLEKARMIAIGECSSLLRGGKNTTGIEKITYAKWTVVKDIKLVAIVHEDIFSEVANNPLLEEMKRVYTEYKRLNADVDIIARFFAEEFSKEEIRTDSDYFISAVLTDVITDDLGYDGVLYPSVRLGGQLGFNVAITPHITDANMKLDAVAESTLYKKGEKSYNLIDKYSTLGTWQYKDDPLVAKERLQLLEELQINSFEELTS